MRTLVAKYLDKIANKNNIFGEIHPPKIRHFSNEENSSNGARVG